MTSIIEVYTIEIQHTGWAIMKKAAIALMGIWLGMAAAFAAEPPFKDSVPDTYTVKKGDTLWDISAFYLREPWLWPEIWHVNPQIKNPHLIYPGDVISLVYIDGQPRLTLNRGRNVKLSPQVRAMAHGEAIATLPLDAINSFLSRTRVVAPGELEAAPYVVAGQQKRIISGIGDDLYARGTFAGDDGTFGVYRQGDPYIDPDSEEVLGVRAQDVGAVQLKAVNGDVGTAGVLRSEQEIRIGDRLLPGEERKIDPVFYPSAPADTIDGVIIAVEGGVNNVGHLDVVAINRGERDGLAVGNMLAIYKRGETVADRIAEDTVTLPPERAGLVMIFRAFEKMSFGLVLNADRPLSVKDLVRNP